MNYSSTKKRNRIGRKNFMVDGQKVKKLKGVLGASSESEAIRIVVDHALDAARAWEAFERIRLRGTWGHNLALDK